MQASSFLSHLFGSVDVNVINVVIKTLQLWAMHASPLSASCCVAYTGTKKRR